MTKIYGIKTCGSVKKAIKFFKEHNLQFQFIDFRETPLDQDKIEYFTSKINIDLLFNNRSTTYRTLGLKELKLDNNSKLEWLIKENMLLKRPIIEYANDKILIAFSEEVYKKELL